MTSNSDVGYSLFFKLLVKCPVDRLGKLFHHFIDTFCGQQNVIYNNYSDIYSLFEWWDLIDQSKIFLKEHYSQDNTVPTNLESLPGTHSEIIKDILDVRAPDLKNELIEKSHAVAPAYLTSFDWKLMLTLASDKMSQINEPRLLLDIDTSGNNKKALRLDLGKDELKSLIDNMEKIKIGVLDLKTADI